ncbi:MAG: hybrid sensor histidine kinase/response regulator, partial [Dehalococcoidia bacterium]
MSEERDLSGLSMHELFRIETEAQGAALTDGLLALERDPRSPETLESLMRAAHSIKGAARIIKLEHAVRVAHGMEDCFVAAEAGKIVLAAPQVDVLLGGVDMLTRLSQLSEDDSGAWCAEHEPEINALLEELSALPLRAAMPKKGKAGGGAKGRVGQEAHGQEPSKVSPAGGEAQPRTGPKKEGKGRVLRISPEQIDQLLGLAGEVQMQWKWLKPYADSLLLLKRRIAGLEAALGGVEASQEAAAGLSRIKEARTVAAACRGELAERLSELEAHERTIFNLSQRLYHQSVSSRMQPFADGMRGFKRMVRDLAQGLGREARLEIVGADTLVDRDILEKIEAPLNHLLRNAVDHGIEPTEERRERGKPPVGTITIEARHHAGMLRVIVSDDGRGIDFEALGRTVVEQGLATADMVGRMSEAELADFLYLPKFTMKESVSEISGRGVGLDVVASVVNGARGVVRTGSVPGQGTRIELQLPVTLSVMRSMLVWIAGEPFAFPLARIERALRIGRDNIEWAGGRRYITVGGQHTGLVSAWQALGLAETPESGEELHVVVLGGGGAQYGLIVDAFLGECDLVEKRLDPRLGKVRDIAAAALTADGQPLLVIDVNDLLRSVEKLVADGRLAAADRAPAGGDRNGGKRILVVDDSITVREVERKLLAAKGYEVEVAVDGMDGWNSIRGGKFDLVISDVDMPRMDGINLVHHIKSDPGLKATPVVIVSYKESDEDRMRGLEAGADSYLTKSSFH